MIITWLGLLLKIFIFLVFTSREKLSDGFLLGYVFHKWVSWNYFLGLANAALRASSSSSISSSFGVETPRYLSALTYAFA